MRDDYIQSALKVIDDPNILVNVVSLRVKQLKRGNRPLITSLEKLSAEDTALREIAEGKISYELATAEAKKLIDAAIDELGPLPDLLDTRGMIHMAAGESQQAVSDFAEAVLQPTDVKFLHLAWAQMEAGDKAAAKDALEAGRRRGLASSRLSAEDRERLAKLEAAFGVPSEAAEPQG
jgi:DNA-directed RNA polymerase subunit omega